MDRLTKREETGWVISIDGRWIYPTNPLYSAIEKLAHYEDLEEQGRLIELPCAVDELNKKLIIHYCIEEAEAKLKELEG